MRRISKKLYVFSFSTWVACIAAIVVGIFLDIMLIAFIPLFISCLAQTTCSGLFSNKIEPEIPDANSRFDTALSITLKIACILTSVGFVSLLIAGGGPEIVDGRYCVVNHGEVVRIISGGWYRALCVCEFILFSMGIYYFATYTFKSIRRIYLYQSSKICRRETYIEDVSDENS